MSAEGSINFLLDGSIFKTENTKSSSTMQTVEILSPSERIKRFGIECSGPLGDGISFLAGHWKPGGEYIQKLTIKNVGTTTKKLKYKLPTSRFFSMAFPEVIILSPGMFTEIDVIFRPVENDPYDDSIYIKMQEGIGSQGFHVPVKAMIEKLIVSAPFGIDLGYCPAFQTTSQIFQLRNVGEIDAPFRWEIPEPFHIEPAEGIIAKGHHQDIKVSLFPYDATVFVAQATCIVGEGVHAIIPEPLLTTRFSGIGKHAYISLSEADVSFGEVLCGAPAPQHVKEVVLRNTSVVPAEFELIRHEGDRDEVFDIHPRGGVIEPMSELTVTIRYHALAMGTYSLDRYTYKTPGNCRTTLTCSGMSMPPKLTLFKDMDGPKEASGIPIYSDASPGNSINFRDVEVGRVETRLFYLRNDSNVDTHFCIIADTEGIFKFEPKQGMIPALAHNYPVKLTFAPPKPINYCRRIFVLIKDAMPLFYDAMGSGHIRAKGEIKEQRPLPIRHAHIQAYRNRAVNGLGVLSPDELDAMYEQELGDRAFFAETGIIGTQAMSVASTANPLTRNGESTRTAVASAQEFFIEDTDSSVREITISKNRLNFHYTPYLSTSDPQNVVITNRTRGKVTIMWIIPRIHDDSGKFEPSASLSKTGRDGPVKDDIAVPTFEVDPPFADINAGKSQTFRVLFRPRQSNRNYFSELEAFVFFKNQRTFRLVHDYSLTPPWCLTVAASGHTFGTGQLLAKGVIAGGSVRSGKLVFPACFTNEECFETVMVCNTSNLPCTFEMVLGFESGGTAGGHWGGEVTSNPFGGNSPFTVKPACGEIAAEGFVLICIRFAPKDCKKYVDMLRCIINGESSGKVLLEGTGDIPFLYFPELKDDGIDDPYLGRHAALGQMMAIPRGFQGAMYLKPTCVGLSTTREVTVKNGSRLPVRFRITPPAEASGILSVTPLSGLLRGNETLTLTLSFAPKESILYNLRFKMKTFPIGGKSKRIVDARQVGIVDAPEILQSLIFDFVCPGEISAMTFDPGRLTIDVRLVNTFEMKEIFLENISDADLSYQLFYRIEFIPDSAQLAKTKMISTLRPIFKGRDDRNLLTEGSGDPVDHSLFCEFPSGILPARSRKCVQFTFYPDYAGLFGYLIYSRLQALDPATGEPVFISNEEAVLLRTSQPERDGIVFDGEEYTDDYPPSAASDSSLPVMANVTARAAFPTMLIEDIRTSEDLLVSDVDNLWAKFHLAELNYDMSTPPTVEEIKIFTSSTLDHSKLKRYAFEFSPAVVGSPQQKIYLQIRNNGFLTTSFHMHLPNEKELDLEPWCDEDEPSEELNRIISTIEELKCFTFEPSRAVLEPGETVMMTLTYSHAHLKYDGLHEIPILVKVDTGKIFFIDLKGRTVPMPASENKKGSGSNAVTFSANPSQQNMAQASSNNALLATAPDLAFIIPAALDGVVTFQSIPVGLREDEAPRQRLEIVNVSALNGAYDIDVADVQELSNSNFQQNIARLVNPKGVVQAKGSIYLEWYMYPLEIRDYEFNITVTYIVSALPGINSASSFESMGSLGTGLISAPPSNNKRGITSATDSDRGSRSGNGPPSALKKPPSASMSSLALGGGGKNNSALRMRPLLPQTLTIKIKFTGYDPRLPKPLPYGADFGGGLPPPSPIMRIPGQQVLVSNDLVDFKLIPQSCSAHRLVILKNILPTAAVEIYVDDSCSFLCADGLMSVTPSGILKLEAGDQVVFDLKICADAPATVFADRLKIVVREIIKDTNKRSGGATARLKERLMNNKAVPKNHESVVTHTTFSTSMRLEEKFVPEGKVAALPSTMDVDGSLIEPVKAAEKIANFAADEGGGYGYYGGATSREVPLTGAMSESKSRLFTGKSTNAPLDGGASGVSRGGLTASALSLRNSTELSAARSQNGASRLSSRSSRNGEGATLLGDTTVVILRITGEIFTIETSDKLLGLGPLKDVVKSFLVPPVQKFIAPATVSRPTEVSGGGVNGAAAAYVVGGGTILEGDDDATVSIAGTPTARTPLTRGSKARGNATPGTPSGARSPKRSTQIHKPLESSREPEVREAVEDVMCDVFRNLLGSLSLRDYSKAVIEDSLLSEPLLGGLKLDTEGAAAIPGASELTEPLLGKPIYGVYFPEIFPERPLYERLVRELKHMGYASVDEPSKGSKHMKLGYHGTGTNVRAAVVDGIPAQWVDGDGLAMLADASHFALRKSQIASVLQIFELTPKGSVFKTISKILDRNFAPEAGSPDPSVCLSKLLALLPSDVDDVLSKKVNSKFASRMRQNLESHRTTSTLSPDAASAIAMDSADLASENNSVAGSVSSYAADSIGGGGIADLCLDSDDEDAAKEVAIAAKRAKGAQALQRIARGAADRDKTTGKFKDLEDAKIKESLCSEEFFDWAGDILCNTMFNLVQEAAFGEFAIESDPMKFAMKKSDL